MDTAKIEAGVRMILEGVGENPDREGLKETPARVARMYEEVFAGLTEDPAVHFATTFDEHCSEMVLVRDIYFYSMCEHHLVPFFGKATSPTSRRPTAVCAACRSWRVWSKCMRSVRRCRSV